MEIRQSIESDSEKYWTSWEAYARKLILCRNATKVHPEEKQRILEGRSQAAAIFNRGTLEIPDKRPLLKRCSESLINEAPFLQ